METGARKKKKGTNPDWPETMTFERSVEWPEVERGKWEGMGIPQTLS